MKNIQKRIYILPTCLFPTETIESISNNRIQFYIECFKNDIKVKAIQVVCFEDNYYILDGHHLALAAILENIEKVEIEIVDFEEIRYLKNKDDFCLTLNGIGMRTLYDFETIGNFSYPSYPIYYKNHI